MSSLFCISEWLLIRYAKMTYCAPGYGALRAWPSEARAITRRHLWQSFNACYGHINLPLATWMKSGQTSTWETCKWDSSKEPDLKMRQELGDKWGLCQMKSTENGRFGNHLLMGGPILGPGWTMPRAGSKGQGRRSQLYASSNPKAKSKHGPHLLCGSREALHQDCISTAARHATSA